MVQDEIQRLLSSFDHLITTDTPSEVLSVVDDLKSLCRETLPSMVFVPKGCSSVHMINLDRTPPYDFCTYEEVMSIMHHKFGKEKGGLKAWEDRILMLSQTDEHLSARGKPPLNKWRLRGKYPVWAVRILMEMSDDSLHPFHKWSADDRQYLLETYVGNPDLSDDELAEKCTEKFGRLVNSNSIKSKLHDYRVQHKISFRCRSNPRKIWRPVKDNEIFPPGGSYRMNQKTGVSEVLEIH